MTNEELINHIKYDLEIGADITLTNEDAEKIIKALEQEPKTGHWIVHPKGIYAHLVCDKCLSNAPYDCRTKYCPNCGAEMIESQESDHKCNTCKHYTSGEHDGSCGSYICKGYSNWEREE